MSHKFWTSIFSLLLFGLLCFSCKRNIKSSPNESSVVKVQENKIDPVAAIATQVAISSNVTYNTVDGMDLKLDVYFQGTSLGEGPIWFAKKKKPQPTLLYIHGGGWQEGNKETRALKILPYIFKGWTVVNIDYRLAKDAPAPAAIYDCITALNWIGENAERYGFDTSKIVVSGESAGGHLSLMAGLLNTGDEVVTGMPKIDKKVNIAAIINWYGITDIAKQFNYPSKEIEHPWLKPGQKDTLTYLNKLSPIYYVKSDSPPVITIHGTADPVVPYAQAPILKKYLDEANVLNTLIKIDGKKHGNFSAIEQSNTFQEIWGFLENEAKIEF